MRRNRGSRNASASSPPARPPQRRPSATPGSQQPPYRDPAQDAAVGHQGPLGPEARLPAAGRPRHPVAVDRRRRLLQADPAPAVGATVGLPRPGRPARVTPDSRRPSRASGSRPPSSSDRLARVRTAAAAVHGSEHAPSSSESSTPQPTLDDRPRRRARLRRIRAARRAVSAVTPPSAIDRQRRAGDQRREPHARPAARPPRGCALSNTGDSRAASSPQPAACASAGAPWAAPR